MGNASARAARTAGWLAALLLWTTVSLPAAADLLRCVGPDGKVIYTDNKAVCPEAEPFEPDAELQKEDTAARAGQTPAAADPLAERLRRARQRQAAAEAEEGEAERWQQKKTKLEEEIEKLRQKREHLERFITNCNRGGLTYARDDAGIKRTLKCSDIKAQYANLGAEEEAAHAALAALPEECRKAGCLPGWLR
jgi:hypothetical protein